MDQNSLFSSILEFILLQILVSFFHQFKEVKQILIMSNSNRSEHKTPNPKLARYLHRIQQLVGNRGRTPSPLSSRISKPLKPNALDHYLKYELTLKILCGFFDKNNQACMRHFFSIMRTKKNNSKIQKIYKFVPIEKTQCAHMVVDSGISTKMLVNLLKIKIKDNLRLGFEAIKSPDLSQSQIVIINTNRTNRSNIVPLINNSRKNHMIVFALQILYIKRIGHVLGRIRLAQISNINEQKIYKVRQQILIQSTKDNLKARLLLSVIQKIYKQNLKSHLIQIQKECQLKIKELRQCQKDAIEKINILSNVLFISHKNRILYQFNNFISKYQQIVQKDNQNQKLKQQEFKNSLVLSSDKFNKTRVLSDSAMKQQAANWLGMILISLFFRRKLYSMRRVQRYSWKKVMNFSKLYNLLQKKELLRLRQGFNGIYINRQYKKQKISQKNQINWRSIGILINMNKLFIKYLQQPYELIKQYSQIQKFKQKSLITIIKYQQKIEIFKSFVKIKQIKSDPKLETSKAEQKSMQRQHQRVKVKQYLPKVLYKLAILRQIDMFINLKNLKRKKISNVQKEKPKSQWTQDIQDFISQRNRFNKSLLDNYGKIQEMINNDSRIYDSNNSQYRRSTIQSNGINHTPNKEKKLSASLIVK